MNRWMIVWVLTLACCQRNAPEQDAGHSHAAEPPSHSYTLYSDKTELFVEFRPLVVDQAYRLAVHITRLGESFTALKEGTVTLSLVVEDKGIRTTVDKASSPGIFQFSLKPTTTGTGKLIFDITTADFIDELIIDSVTVYTDQKAADAVVAEDANVGTVSFLKEQAWRIEFANERVEPQRFYEIIKTSGKLNARPTDEQIVAARSSGIVRWNEKVVPGASVLAGQELFVLASGNLAQGNIESQYREAKSNFERWEAEFNRVQPLLTDKIISQKDYAEIKNRYEQNKIEFETLGRNYTQGGQSVQAPMDGFVKQITVRSGEFVRAGEPLAIIIKDNTLQLEARVPLRYSNQLPLVTEAMFKTLHDSKVHKTADLNGRIMSYGKAVGESSGLLPIYFSITNDGSLIAGDVVEVSLRSRPISSALVVPVTALIEEQGNFYVYVQTAGERFEKRQVTAGGRDGIAVHLLRGIAAGERVVTKGAYMIKLATQSAAEPPHGHEH